MKNNICTGFLEIKKCGGSNKACRRWENCLKKNKICCVLIREFRVTGIFEKVLKVSICSRVLEITGTYTIKKNNRKIENMQGNTHKGRPIFCYFRRYLPMHYILKNSKSQKHSFPETPLPK